MSTRDRKYKKGENGRLVENLEKKIGEGKIGREQKGLEENYYTR